jgi:hypothetical protein
MADNRDQNEYPLPAGNGTPKRKSAELLPRYFRTQANKKLLGSTLDQLTQPGTAEKIDGYFGRKTAKSFSPGDTYIEDVSVQRQNRQLEPASVVKDDLDNVEFFGDYTDYINQLNAFNGSVSNQSLLNSQEYYSWNPNIDWDKFVNFREYFWLPNGPQTIDVFGQSQEVQSTYTVTTETQDDNVVYKFSPGLTPNPSLKLYRGQTYKFEIDTPGHPIAFSTDRRFLPGDAIAETTQELIDGEIVTQNSQVNFQGDENVSSVYNKGITKTQNNQEIQTVYVESGIIEFTIPLEAPDRLYYVSRNDVNASGIFKIYDIEDNTSMDVENEIIGKKSYTSANGVEFTNGLKVRFKGNITPEKYASDEWYVEGVGNRITLIKESDLTIPAAYTEDELIPFDSRSFDRLPFGNANSFAEIKDYVVINKASRDRNAWSRYNRWFHQDVIHASARYNNQPAIVDQSARAKRPIIEFEPGLKLYNFGTQAKNDIDLIDTVTKDAFSTVEGSLGYNVDGIQLADGMRIIFAEDTDRLVNGKVYVVNFELIKNTRQISLIEDTDSQPLENETVLTKNGKVNRGKIFYYTGEQWKLAQEKISTNQPPVFDLFDRAGNSYSNKEIYPATTFAGNQIFSYKDGPEIDSELGFGINYRNIENTGDIVFDFDLLKESFTYQDDDELYQINTDTALLRKYTDRENFVPQNGWSKANAPSKQAVVRQYITDDQFNNFAVDVFDSSGSINDLQVKVYVNNNLKVFSKHYEIDRINDIAYVRFYNDLEPDSVVLLKCSSSTPKNNNGYYEIAHNLERNPLNKNISSFTFGEVSDHLESIVENLNEYNGDTFPGPSNLRDLGNIDSFGTRFVQHSGPVNLSLYSVTDKNSNIIKAIKFNRAEYAKFKRVFLQTAEKLGFDGPVKKHVDRIIQAINKEKSESMPFYFSDMLGYLGERRTEHVVRSSNSRYFALSEIFNPKKISSKSVLVYLNGTQLVHEKEYIFTAEGFVNVTVDVQENDLLEIYEYDSTDGSFIPPTPTKLGLYPKFEPYKFIDDTYIQSKEVIQCHDGSIVFAYNDYRDDLILELEKRIYNNIKQDYKPDILDIYDFLPGEYRETGFDKKSIDKSLISDFIEWSVVAGDPDYTTTDFYERTNGFTFNYSSMISPNGSTLSGFWRAVYKQAYDTDRPHTHPWEMLGYSKKPDWWDSVYGSAPYTNNNLILWRDIAEGIIRKPGKSVSSNKKFARPGILNHLPVDDSGNLLDPLTSGYAINYVERLARQPFVFGDESPAETAWRRSSEYPFALLTAWMLNQPAKVMGLGFDISRIARDSLDQIVYTETNKRIRLQDLVFPNTVADDTRKITSGLVNFVHNYMISNVLLNYENYKNHLAKIDNQLALKVGGFTEKEKFNLILDSRTPFNKGNIFVPKENYQIFLNTSSAIDVANYSGVIVEKVPGGFTINGYDRLDPVFYYKEAKKSSNDPVINVGGLSEEFVEWSERKQYVKGTNVRYNTRFYRVTESHISNNDFDETKFQLLASLPQVGGRDAVLRRNYTNRTQTLSYGTVLSSVQDVVDFLLGYERYLEEQGFNFDYFNKDIGQVENWTFSVREFLFWTTQNWAAGSVITLSPGANEISFEREFSVVDDIFDNFYDYTLLKADGKKLDREFSSIARDNENAFGLRSKNTADGIFNIKLPLVQKEHVVLLDNKTVFEDVIYDQEAGYRQERIRVKGYRSDNWKGGLDIPGFIYDEAKVVDWETWKDYSVGTVVKYKQFYYIALDDLPGSEVFVSKNWQKLDGRPESKLIPNFDYRINQFTDFYDLDSDNFDAEQQKHAQHLTGYQKRQYLQNIINDDVSQYKFYQGMIQDKGTKNVLDKLFNALSSANKDSLEFYEEWAVRLGRYGSTKNTETIEFTLDESKFRLDTQPVELVSRIDSNTKDLVYRQQPFEIYSRPDDYNNNPFPTTTESVNELRSAGYVKDDDVVWRINDIADILGADINSIAYGDYIWVSGLTDNWTVLQHTITKYSVLAIEGYQTEYDALDRSSTPGAIITLDKQIDDITPGNVVGVRDIDRQTDSFYIVENVTGNKLNVQVEESVEVSAQESATGFLTVLRTVRFNDVEQANTQMQNLLIEGQKLWVDNTENNWYVLKNQKVFEESNTVVGQNENIESNFGLAVDASKSNKTVVVGDSINQEVYSFTRASEFNNLVFESKLQKPLENQVPIDPSQDFGKTVAISPDGQYLAVGSPLASNIASPYKGAFLESEDYNSGDIIKYSGQLWKAQRDIPKEAESINFSTFDSYAFLEQNADSTDLTLLLQGQPYLSNVKGVDHMLVRAPYNQYIATKPNDQLTLKWNKYTNLNRDQEDDPSTVAVEPFDGAIPDISADFITGEHNIVEKIDYVLFFDSVDNEPNKGDKVSTSTGTGTVAEKYSQEFSVVLYIKDINGVFNQEDTLFINGQIVGEYTQPAMTYLPALGGFWLIHTPEYDNTNNFGDSGHGLVYQDIKTFDETTGQVDPRDTNFYANVLDDVSLYSDTRNAGFLINLSYRGDVQGVIENNPDSRWLVRLPVSIETELSPGSKFKIWVNNSIVNEDITDYGFEYSRLNDKEHTVDDIWDGYVDFTFNTFQTVDADNDNKVNDPFEPPLDNFDNIEKIYKWSNGQTVTVFDNITGATGEVAFYQKTNIFDGRVYLKNVTGSFSVGNDIRIEFLEDGIFNSRTMGQIIESSLADSEIGKLAVVDEVNFEFPVFEETYLNPLNDFALVNGEYWIYQENLQEQGASQEASYPSSINRDWEQVFNIPVQAGSLRNGVSNQGAYSIYRRIGNSWVYNNTYIIPDMFDSSSTGYEVSKKIQFLQFEDLYKLYVGSTNKIHIINHGKDTSGNVYNWALDVDRNYRGDWNPDNSYLTDEIVIFDNKIYKSDTVSLNSDSVFDTEFWKEVDNNVIIQSYLPYSSSGNIYGDSTYSNTDPVLDFTKDFSVSENAQVLVTVVETGNNDSQNNQMLIYRQKDNRYRLSQIIDAPTKNTKWGESIDISPDGRFIVVGEPESDTIALDQGTVYIFRQVDEEFVLDQTLGSPNNQSVEKFGFKVSATNNMVAISSFNGDLFSSTMFDSKNTVFDNGFTQFTNQVKDTGSVTLFEEIDNQFLYADRLEYSDAKNSEFGESLLAVDNHIYTGLPRKITGNITGQVVDYRRTQNQLSWNKLRQSLPVVDTNKIKQAYLYNKKTDQLVTYLDFIDPVQGKIAGPADAEITFKMFKDPARYNNTNLREYFDETANWEDQYVGKVWWDLSTARFKNAYQGDAVFQSSVWNALVPGSSIDVYEWVESDIIPSEWDNIADTPEGISKGISGQSKYGDDVYSQKLTYDSVSGNFGAKYYFWVKDKFTVPSIDTRKVSIANIARLIQDPNQENYKFVAFYSSNRFAVYNCNSLISDTDIALVVEYYTLDNQEQNTHTEYQILSEGLATSVPKPDIEQKWVDSLVGYDQQGRKIPDPDLSPRQRYGTMFRPRQSWFVNRQEALKQVVERANISLQKRIIVDDFDLSKMFMEDPAPTEVTRLYDYKISSEDELKFIGTSKAKQAKIDLEVDNGVVTRAIITDPGRSYNDLSFNSLHNNRRKGPTYSITGTGQDLELDLTINNLGLVTDVEIVNPGKGYDNNTFVTVRKLSVLVENDSTINGRWSIYEWDDNTQEWNRTLTQEYDVKKFWQYSDWYAKGVNEFTVIDKLVDFSYELTGLDTDVGDVVKISSIGAGGWLLLRKISNDPSRDYTVNYETIGRQNGTIKLKDTLYSNIQNNVGFDTFIYDGKFFDAEPSTETRLILQALRDDIFVDDLAIDYNELFFASIRYVLSEQLNVDWVFKTSFVKAKHNIGQLQQKVTFQNDNLSSYNDYIEEVKPYKTNIREYLSSYEKTDNTRSVLTDFDLAPVYKTNLEKIIPKDVKIIDDKLVGTDCLDLNCDTFPDKPWKDNVGFKITDIEVYDGGSGYTLPPTVTLEGGGGAGATARAFISAGRITQITVTNAGSGYTSAPRVIIQGSQTENSRPAIASAVLGNSVVRSMTVGIKFDRVSGDYYITELEKTQEFSGTNVDINFDLEWPMDLRNNKVIVTVDGEKALRSEYTYTNVKDTAKGYERYHGRIEFTMPPALNSVIVVNYYIDPKMLNAQDRINHLYNPRTGMLGSDLGQLMTGVDYGGVEVRSFDFDGPAGWDTDQWYTTTWDTYDNTYEDQIFRPDGSTSVIELDEPLESGIIYNIYRNSVRIDDPNFGTPQVTNPNAEIPSITGDGEQTLINLLDYGIEAIQGDVFIVRKTTSDGSFLPDPDSYDTSLSGGDLNYGNASGISANDVIVDGDGFVTPVTSSGPEELVPGQILDTVNIKVFERTGSGQGNITNQNYTTDGFTDTFDLETLPASADSVIIKLDNQILSKAEYSVDYKNQKLTLNATPDAGIKLTILTIDIGGQNILDINTIVSDGSTKLIETNLAWQDNLDSVIAVNGKIVVDPEVLIVETNGKVGIEFAPTPPGAGTVIDYGIFVQDVNDPVQNYSRLIKDTFTADGSTVDFVLSQAPAEQEPVEYYTIVQVDNRVLVPGYNKEFVVEENQTEFNIDKFQIPASTITPTDVEVYLNGKNLQRNTQFILNVGNSSIQISENLATQGDELEVFVSTNGEYSITGKTLTLNQIPDDNEKVNVYQFTNHNILDIERQTYDVVSRSSLVAGSEEYSKYHNLTGGRIKLNSPAAGAQYIWVIQNGIILSPTVDYQLSVDKSMVYLNNQPSLNDTIDIIHFAAPVSTPRIAWTQFKDILNRTHYKRYDNSSGTVLAKPLTVSDIRIEMNDASSLPEPSKKLNRPGVVFIEGERIEYFVKENNTLRQLRRGTLGTGIGNQYDAGTVVIDQGISKNIPYKDETITELFFADGTSNHFALDFEASSTDEFEVFVAGKRLRKSSIQYFNPEVAQDSPEGDTILPPEFTLNANTLILQQTPKDGTKIIVVRKIGKLWSNPGTPLKDADNVIGNFLRNSTSELPK